MERDILATQRKRATTHHQISADINQYNAIANEPMSAAPTSHITPTTMATGNSNNLS
jgi:hypothetical protein